MFMFGVLQTLLYIATWNTVDLGIDSILSSNVYKHQNVNIRWNTIDLSIDCIFNCYFNLNLKHNLRPF